MRQRFMFWLDHEKPQEKRIAEDIQALKQAGKFARTIRDGIRLINDLSQGRTNVLKELFPWVLEQQEITLTTLTNDTFTQKDAIQQQLERLETLLLVQGAKPIQTPTSFVSTEHDDLELEITEASHTEDNRSDWNFMLASAMQVQGSCDGLPQEIIEYGLRTGRIKEHDVPHTRPLSTLMREEGVASGPRAMNVPQFDAPAFDDLDLPLDSS